MQGPVIDGVDLKTLRSRAERRGQLVALGLLALPVFFLLLTIILPVLDVVMNSVKDPTISRFMPRFAAQAVVWDGKSLPGEEMVKVFIEEILAADERRSIGRISSRANGQIAGMRSMVLDTALALSRHQDAGTLAQDNYLDQLVEIDSRWQERRYWVAFKQAAPAWTARHFLRLVDLEHDIDGNIVPVEPKLRLYVRVFFRTLWICTIVTILCVLIAYPISYYLASLPTERSNLVLLFLLLPLWTSMLVKSLGWLVSLQNEGVINDLGIILGFWDEPFEMAHHRRGTYVAMIHILLPFMAFPLFAVMRGIDPHHMKAAAIMGATPWRAFFRVYLPQSLPGVGAGALLVFILSLGLYVPPALVGGPGDQMLSYFVAQNVNSGLGGALSLELLVIVSVFLLIYQRIFGIGKLWFN